MPPVIRIQRLTKRFGAELRERGFVRGAARRGLCLAGRKRRGEDHCHPHHAGARAAQLRPVRSPRAQKRQARLADPPTRRLRGRAADALRMDERRGNRLVHGRVLRARILSGVCQVGHAIRVAAEKETQGALERNAGQGGAFAGVGTSAGFAGAGRTDLRSRRYGAAQIPGEHGRSRLAGPDRVLVEPSDHRGRAGGRHRGDSSQGETAVGRAARRTQGAGAAIDHHAEGRSDDDAGPRRIRSFATMANAARPGDRARHDRRPVGDAARQQRGCRGRRPRDEPGRHLYRLHAGQRAAASPQWSQNTLQEALQP